MDSLLRHNTFLLNKDSICLGESISFSHQMISNTIDYLQWQFGDGTETISNQDNILHAYDVSGIMPITLIARFRACPENQFTDTIYVSPLPEIFLGSDTALCGNASSIVLYNRAPQEENNYQFLWNTGETTKSISVRHSGIYSLRISDPHNCSNTETITVHKDCYGDIPNVFTPNADDINDYFFPRQLLSHGVTKFKLQVLNRWGQMIFTSTQTNGRGWDGRLNGKEQPQGVYIYQIDLETEDLTTEHYQGNVTLIR